MQSEKYGSEDICFGSNEKLSRDNARRSLVLNKDIPAGKAIELSDLTWKRPAHGISPASIDQVVGKKLLIGQSEDTVLMWELFES